MSQSEPVLFLHVGYPKTGSSTLQLFCDVNRKILREKGICYPDPCREFLLSNYNRGHIYCCESLGLTNFALSDWRVIRKKYLDEFLSCGCATNLLSSEQFLFEHSDNIEFWHHYFKMKGICYFRTLFEYLNSLQKEFVKECLRPDVFTFIEFRNLRILGALKFQIQSLGRENWIFKDYNKVVKSKEGLIQDFMRIIGVEDIAGFSEIQNQNTTPCDALLTFLYQLSFIPFDYQEALCIGGDITGMDLPEYADFQNNFLPSDIYQLDDYAEWAIKFQGELLGDPDWFDRTVARGEALSRIRYKDLPPEIQHAIFDKLSEKSRELLIRFLPAAARGGSAPFLPAMEGVEAVLPVVLPLYARYVSTLGENLKYKISRQS